MRRVPVLLCVLGVTFTPVVALAGSGLSAAALLGFATDNLNLGLGARIGYTLPSVPVYLGGTFVYHLGQSQSVFGVEASAHLYYLGFEAGYEFATGPVTIRPYLGIGPATISVSGEVCPVFVTGVPCQSYSESDTRLAAWPGASVLVPLGAWFVGGDARFLLVSDSNSLGLFGTGGISF
jgi:hypothetical protein